MFNLEIINNTSYIIPRKRLETLADKASKYLKLRKEWQVSVAFVSPAKIRQMNKVYRHKDKVTDVLSFIEKAKVPGEPDLLGEIIICPSRAKSQAPEFKHSLTAEYEKLLLHGLLHLLGYDHEREREAVVMEGEEERILNLL